MNIMKEPFTMIPRTLLILLALLLPAAAACQERPAGPLPTSVSAANTPAPTITRSGAVAPATWTPAATAGAADQDPLPTVAPRPTGTPVHFPTNTPRPSPTSLPTDTPAPSPTPSASATNLPPPTSGNLLPNGSFEEGWYHINGIPELQIANRWQLTWEEGPNPLDHDPAPWVRPEARVLTPDFLPADEHDLFIWHGNQTVKIFKGTGAISFALTTRVHLDPGAYVLEINVFPDLVDEYAGGVKVWAPDPLSGEVLLITPDGGTGWILPQFGRKNTFAHLFHVDTAGQVEVGAAMRGRWAILNNGWFIDDWRLTRVD
jgi:hypothetical protein